MRTLKNVIVAGALLASAALLPGEITAAESGQGPVTGGEVRIDNLDLGEYWYGSQITHEDLIGKVVLVEIWGS